LAALIALYMMRTPFAFMALLGGGAFITVLLAPVLYSIFVLDLKIVKWTGPAKAAHPADSPPPQGESH
jgi:hypothetical protein